MPPRILIDQYDSLALSYCGMASIWFCVGLSNHYWRMIRTLLPIGDFVDLVKHFQAANFPHFQVVRDGGEDYIEGSLSSSLRLEEFFIQELIFNAAGNDPPFFLKQGSRASFQSLQDRLTALTVKCPLVSVFQKVLFSCFRRLHFSSYRYLRC